MFEYLTFKTCSKGSYNLIQKENMKKNLLLTSIALMSVATAMAEGVSTPNKHLTHSAAILQQKATASGKVLDSNGEPLIGVTIMEEGTQNGTVTGLDGSFSLNVTKSNAMLKFSYIGFTDVKLPAAHNLTVTMNEEQNALNEVVVVGYGTQKKVNLTGSVVSVDLAKETNSRPVTTAAQALQGMAAGLDIIQGSGKPGEENFSVNIRGVGTMNDASPLVLVDGMEMSLSEINPMDIESISVLKDAASCAIYGNRGANGVILVTTKSGTEGNNSSLIIQ